MHIADILQHQRPTFSFEFFPPKSAEAFEALYGTVAELEALRPSFVSETYGAGIANLIKYALGIPPKQLGNAGLPTGDVEDYGASDYLTLVYTRDKSVQNITLIVEVSGDLGTWNSGLAHTTEVSRVSHPNNTETVTVRDHVAVSTGQERFIRLKIVQ